MTWFTTAAVEEFLAAAGEFLRAEPVRNTVVLSVTQGLRGTPGPQRGPVTGGDAPLFGWWRPEAGSPGAAPAPVAGAFMHTPPFPVFLTGMSCRAAAALAGKLAAAGRRIPAVNAEADGADAFADAWRQRTGDAATVRRRMRLYRLDRLVLPDPGPAGAPRVADERDRSLLIEWFAAFTREVDDPPGRDHGPDVDDRLGYGGLTVWEAGGVPVSVAGTTRPASGMVRVGPVYTPPALRGRGYAGAVTAAATQYCLERARRASRRAAAQAALGGGAAEVVLYADLANPTSNVLYQRLGYRPVEDRVMLSLGPKTPHPG